ncbi:MAG: histidinol-phosphatase HisJ family protein [Oscillospiraceae bacterium]|nr:histidinol-phosphatase HisJ family protein [Oscillospiraceae bacterium]
MFDFHLHSSISFDSSSPAPDMCRAAQELGLKEICFTDHYDYKTDPADTPDLFSLERYRLAYDALEFSGLSIRKGVEFGMTVWNAPQLDSLLKACSFDFVIGSVHYVAGHDPYEAAYWEGINIYEAFRKYLQGVLDCVKVHSSFDVLGHLTYVCKSPHNPSHSGVPFDDFRDLTDEIMKLLITKGIGMELNTSGVDRAHTFLPSREYLQRFKELGGEIVTVGSDAHNATRVGQYVPEALALLKDIFGHVCTFENRKPVFHKL